MKKRTVLSEFGPWFATFTFIKGLLARCLRGYCQPIKSLPGFDRYLNIPSCAAGLGIICFLLPAGGHCFVQADLDKLLTTNECLNCDLTEADLAGRNLIKAVLDGAKLSGANLTNATLRMADLEGADFSNANLTDTVFEAADLYRANFAGATLGGAIFEGTYLVEAVFDDRQIIMEQGNGGNNTGVVAADSSGEGEKQAVKSLGDKSSKESSTKIVSAAPGPPTVEAALSPGTETTNLGLNVTALTQPPGRSGIDPDKYMPDPALNIAGFKPFPEDTMVDTDNEKVMMPLNKDDLIDQIDDSQMCVGCDFSGMNLAKTKFKGVYLEGANFEGANLEGANLKAANLKNANLRNANLKKADLRKSDLYKADLTGADLSGADLKGALLLGADLSGANLEGAALSPDGP
jgi:uncharacterized protein YjbI with pentapeptide repeats